MILWSHRFQEGLIQSLVLLSIIKRFIYLLAFPGDPQRARKRALAALIREIPKTGPQWYEPWSDRLSSDFVTVIEKLVDAAQEIVAFLDLLRLLAVDRGTAKQAVSRMVAERKPIEP